MGSSIIPEWQYPLYQKSDRQAYSLLRKFSKKVPELLGSPEERTSFFKLLILTQKMNDYRAFRDILLKYMEEKNFLLADVLEKSKSLSISRRQESWAIFHQDRRICQLLDAFSDKKIILQGISPELTEFTLRFLLTQLLQDWRGPLMMVLLESKNPVSLKKLNKLLAAWDYTNIFR